MLDHYKQIAIFVMVVDHGSFRSAAKSLRMSPSVVSQHVSQLEEALGVALLYRTTRKLALTSDGECLLRAAREMVEALDRGLSEISNAAGRVSGTLKVTAPAVLARSRLVDRIALFLTGHRSVDLSVDFSDMRRDLIGDGFDVAIRMGWLTDSSNKAKKLFEIKRKLVAAKAYADAKPVPQSIEGLVDWDWVELEPVWYKSQTFFRGEEKVEISMPKPRVSVNDANALCRFARQGIGLAIVPDFLAEPEVNNGLLQEVLPDWQVEPVGVYAVWPNNAPRDGLIKLFVKFMSGG